MRQQSVALLDEIPVGVVDGMNGDFWARFTSVSEEPVAPRPVPYPAQCLPHWLPSPQLCLSLLGVPALPPFLNQGSNKVSI